MTILNLLSLASLACGVAFFVASTVGVFRFPDVYMRIHAVAKADNLGLGFIALGIAFQNPGWEAVLKLTLLWLVMLVSIAVSSNVIAAAAKDQGVQPWRRPE